MDTIKCGKCGAAIPAGSKFCMECGSKIEAESGKSRKYSPRLMHYAYGNNQSCGGKSDIIVRNGFVYFLVRKQDEINIKVAPVSDNDIVQTLYVAKGPGCTASCINMVEDELIFYEFNDGHKITAIDVYSGTRRVILENHGCSSIWIENGIIIFVERGRLRSVHIDGSGYFEYTLPFRLSDRIFGYSGNLYAVIRDTGEAVEIPYEKDDFRYMEFTAGKDMIYGIIGNLYFAPDDSDGGPVLLCKNIGSLEITNGVENVDRLVTAFEQYVIFNRKEENEYSFAWNIQTLRVYKLNRYFDIPPYSFTQILSDYILIEYMGGLYKIPAPIFFQGAEPMFEDDKYLFVRID